VSWLVQPRLVNDPFSDPGLFIDFRFGRRALLFDLGDLSALSSRELLRVSHAFVSHAHMDHFSGFDRLLSLCLRRTTPLHLTGPRGFADRVTAKLTAYTWNLLDESSVDFVITVDEFEGRVLRRSRFPARSAFAREEAEPPSLPPGRLLDEDQLWIEAAVLDHGIPCLAFALQERLGVSVWRNGLAQLNLPVGRWLNAAKDAVRRGDPDNSVIHVDAARTIRLGLLKHHAMRVAPGQRIAYVVDIAPHAANVERAARLSHGADQLFIEAAFAEEDAALASLRRHLTASMAGEIAARAGVREVIPFHFSSRYRDRPDLIPDQVNRAHRKGSSGRP
jgi:ribonuclease Z